MPDKTLEATTNKTAAVAGAQAVADAVNKMAQAAVDAAKGASIGPGYDVIVEGTSGGLVVIRGTGMSTNGTVTIGGHPLRITAWGSTRIEGQLDAGVGSGDVVVKIDEKTVKHGYFTAVV